MEKTPFVIRPLGVDDFHQWKVQWGKYLEFYETSVPEDVYTTTFERMLSSERTTQNAFVAEQDGALIGLVHYIYHPHNWKIEDVCYLQDLFVAKHIRKSGVGRALIEAVYAAADQNNTPSVYWLTQDFNAEARKLYDNIAALTPFILYRRK